MLDILIRGGDVVDGSGGPRRRADVAVQSGRIVEVGAVEAEAAVVVEAAGKVVAPGFIDVHTHYDAQVFWDSALTPSPLHGVTSAVAGNCGFTLAPLGASVSDRRYIVEMLSKVEGMPLDALGAAVPLDWSTTADYFDRLPDTAINVGFKVGHSALRRAVMGPEATRRAADDGEVAHMQQLLRDGLEAGAIGFSSSWARSHNDAAGQPIPSRWAERGELVALCEVLRDAAGTSLEFIPCIGAFEPWAADLMADMASAAEATLNWNVLTVDQSNRHHVEVQLSASDVAARRGAQVVALMMPLSFGMRYSFRSGVMLETLPGWDDFFRLAPDRRLAVLADPTGREDLRVAADRAETPQQQRTAAWADHIVWDTVAPQNAPYRGQRIGDVADNMGTDAWDALCRIVVADELRTSFGRGTGVDDSADWAARIEALRDPRTALGASDAGAHLDMFGTFNFATRFLAEAVREHGAIGLEEAVKLMTADLADLYRLDGRGRVRPGAHGDLVVFDPDTVGSDDLAMRFDLPAGAGRLYAGARGVDHVLVNGRMVVEHGCLTDERPGARLTPGGH